MDKQTPKQIASEIIKEFKETSKGCGKKEEPTEIEEDEEEQEWEE
jgi:hypothetical protein